MFPCDDFQQLFQCAASARHGDYGIGFCRHTLFPFVHVGGDDRAAEVRVVPSFVHHETGNDAEYFAAIAEYTVGKRAHQPLIAGTVDAPYAVAGEQFTELPGCFEVTFVYIRAIYAYRFYRFHFHRF